MEKYSTAGQATDDNMTQAHFTLGTYGYKHTLSKYVILTVFPLRQCLHERASMLRYTYIIRLVISRNDRPTYPHPESEGLCSTRFYTEQAFNLLIHIFVHV